MSGCVCAMPHSHEAVSLRALGAPFANTPHVLETNKYKYIEWLVLLGRQLARGRERLGKEQARTGLSAPRDARWARSQEFRWGEEYRDSRAGKGGPRHGASCRWCYCLLLRSFAIPEKGRRGRRGWA